MHRDTFKYCLMENKKKIKIGVIINENDYHVSAELPAEEADKLLALYKEACETVLQGIEDEDQYLTFDPWMKAKDAALYEHALRAFHEEFSIQLGESYIDDKEHIDNCLDVHTPESFDDCYYLEVTNDIKFDYFVEQENNHLKIKRMEFFKTAIAEAINVLALAYININERDPKSIYAKKLKESINRLLYKYTDTITISASDDAREKYPDLDLPSITPNQRNHVSDLIFEHVIPLEVVAQNIFKVVTAARNNNSSAIEDIKKILDQTKVAWITKDEDGKLNSEGLKCKMSLDDPNNMSDPLARYNAIGIKLACLTASGNCTTSVNNK